MTEDRSLDEFAGSDSASGNDDTAEDTEKSAESTEESAESTEETDRSAPSTEAVEPAITTSAWDSDGAACDRCGERTERRWVDDGALVCGDCKTW